MASLTDRRAVKRYAKQVRPGLRVPEEFLDAFEEHTRRDLEQCVRANGSHKTIRPDVFMGVPAGRGR